MSSTITVKKSWEAKMKDLKKTDIDELFKEAKTAKDNGTSLSSAFKFYAAKNGRAAGSVRNAYYSALKNITESEAGSRSKVGEGFSGLTVNKIVAFNDDETDALVKKVLTGVTFGKSVRRSINEISNGEKEALRNQNKYRNILKKDRARVERLRAEIIADVGKCYDPYSKTFDKDEILCKLKSEINALCDKIEKRVRDENVLLKRELSVCLAENAMLKAKLAAKHSPDFRE